MFDVYLIQNESISRYGSPAASFLLITIIYHFMNYYFLLIELIICRVT